METTPLTRDLLVWIASAPRTYRETMEAWRTSCPRLPIWEDAVRDGLVRIRASRWSSPRGAKRRSIGERRGSIVVRAGGLVVLSERAQTAAARSDRGAPGGRSRGRGA